MPTITLPTNRCWYLWDVVKMEVHRLKRNYRKAMEETYYPESIFFKCKDLYEMANLYRDEYWPPSSPNLDGALSEYTRIESKEKLGKRVNEIHSITRSLLIMRQIHEIVGSKINSMKTVRIKLRREYFELMCSAAEIKVKLTGMELYDEIKLYLGSPEKSFKYVTDAAYYVKHQINQNGYMACEGSKYTTDDDRKHATSELLVHIHEYFEYLSVMEAVQSAARRENETFFEAPYIPPDSFPIYNSSEEEPYDWRFGE